MNTRFASAAVALALVAAAPATAAFAQDFGYGAPGYGPRSTRAVEAPRSILGVPSWVFEGRDESGDSLTTGSVAPRRAVDRSAKGGNAAQQDRRVPQYGNTSGGPTE
ncbi:hypothetical protein [Methylobacterium trifolii]|uniref:Uncharacterized protein n=1 Tax=Methylobacterium trifolii TaxID=1003092 RepID=A0ABQ4TZA9_9HYPH|nr:hypothetical protein [Methylobacterium trifolii]GJE60249.1 hypothetical protein MPOCJGCO_2360 [Methylobacterium trifolii]